MSVQANASKPGSTWQPEDAAQHVAELKDENAQLRNAVHAHAVIDQAIGVILAVGELTPDQGWDVLREISQRTNIKLRHVAELLIEWARTGNVCADIRTELNRQLAPYAREPRSANQNRRHLT
ncbi:ANTAR domain-containing protein [Streptomyces sp. NPDC006173]|uniref:ANTAR domain-containing protein n=1 Tax=Streptomyces sp. NPDC006173 TaxID=3155349 RepID=UPI0033C08601